MVYLGALVFSLLLAAPVLSQEVVSERMEAREGETCLVCNLRVGKGDAAYLVGGQRAPVHEGECEGELLAEPAAQMAKTRPNNILFSHTANVGIADQWIWVGVYVLIALAAGGLIAHLAIGKGRRLRGLGKVPLTREPVPCPGCGRFNHPSAARCNGCGGTLEPSAASEVSAVRSAF